METTTKEQRKEIRKIIEGIEFLMILLTIATIGRTILEWKMIGYIIDISIIIFTITIRIIGIRMDKKEREKEEVEGNGLSEKI